MSKFVDAPLRDEIARVAYAIWEAEGQPEGRDHEHWMRARQLIEEGRAEIEYPHAMAAVEEDERGTPQAQPGSKAAAPRSAPELKDERGAGRQDQPGGRSASQNAGLPKDTRENVSDKVATPGPRNPEPLPATNAKGFAEAPSVEDVVGGAVGDDPHVPTSGANSRQG